MLFNHCLYEIKNNSEERISVLHFFITTKLLDKNFTCSICRWHFVCVSLCAHRVLQRIHNRWCCNSWNGLRYGGKWKRNASVFSEAISNGDIALFLWNESSGLNKSINRSLSPVYCLLCFLTINCVYLYYNVFQEAVVVCAHTSYSSYTCQCISVRISKLHKEQFFDH